MKKLLCLVLVLVLAMSIFVGCNKSNDEGAQTPKTEESGEPTAESNAESKKTESASDEKAEANSDVPSADVPAPSTNKEVVTEEEAPEVYLVVGGDDNAASISYHLKDCKLLKGGEAQKVAWEMIKTLGFRQCPECNPPQYESYIE